MKAYLREMLIHVTGLEKSKLEIKSMPSFIKYYF